MNKDINYTLMALVPLLRLIHENIKSIEAVEGWYKVGDREYKKEVAEITYDDGYMMYVDIGCDSNLTACYDILAVIQCIKPKSARIERIKRGIYEMPEQKEEAQRKTEPKPVIYQGDGYADGNMVYDMAECPNCEREFEYGRDEWEMPFCCACGQALEWKAEE